MDKNEVYDKKFYGDMHDANLESARIVIPLVLNYLASVDSVVDVGCGRGVWLQACTENNIKKIFGVDGSWVQESDLVIPTESFEHQALDTDFTLDKKADLAISLEVAEHLPPESADHFVHVLTLIAPVVLFSAAIPGQGGTNHLNEQWPQYWADKFLSRGYVPVDVLRRQLWQREDVAFFYAQNILLFVKEDKLTEYPELHSEITNGNSSALSLVHPTLFSRTHEDAERWKLVVPYINKLPLGILKKIKHLLMRNKKDI